MRREILWFIVLILVISTVLLVGNNHWHRFVDRGNNPHHGDGPDYSHAPATWAGRSTCVECHAVADSMWAGSDHDRAMQVPGPATITADFDGATFTHFGVTSKFYKQDDRYMVHTDGPDGTMIDFEVAYVFGYYPLEQFLIQFPDGRLQALNVCWDSRTADEGGQRWFHLYPDNATPAEDLFHWTGMLQNWNFMCAECHSTRLRRNYNEADNTYDTNWNEMDVSCEACHGPASRHILWEKAQAQGLRPRDESKTRGLVVNLKSPDEGLWVFEQGKSTATRTEPLASTVEAESCARCHSRRSSLTEDYEFGRPFLDHHRLRLLEENYYHADGQNQDEVYVYGSFLQSKMHAAGVTCSDCHDYHSTRTLGVDNQVCAKCHLAEVYDTPEHHFHKLGQGGDSCLDCHQQSRNLMVVDGRRDHSFRLPRPDLSLELGTPNACSDCHLDQTIQWAQDAVIKWYGADRQQGPHYAVAIDAGRTGAPGALDRLRYLVTAPDQPDIAKATALSLINRYALAAEVPEVVQALNHDNALLRGAAVRALENSPPVQRVALAQPLLDDPVRDVRLAAARIVANLPVTEASGEGRADVVRARDIWLGYLAENSERAETQVELASYYLNTGQPDLAEKAYQRATLLEPRYSVSYLNHADFLRRTNQPDMAMAVLRKGIATATEPADLSHSLGLLLVSQGDLDNALNHLKEAARQHPSAARFGYVYAIALHDAGQPNECLDALEKALAVSPWDPSCLQALVVYAMEQGQAKRALGPAEKLVRLNPTDKQASQVLAQVRAAVESGG